MTSEERREGRYQRRKARRMEKRRAYCQKYDDFERLSSVSALIGANWAARKGVMWKASVARYNMHYFRNARKYSRMMRQGKDTRQGFYSFSIVERGKPRDIHSLHYAERVIRRSVCTNAMVPILSHNLIYDNGASLKDKGITFSTGRCEAHLHEYWNRYKDNDGYVLIIDFRKFFDNIQHQPLFEIYDKYFTDQRLNRLCKGFVEATGKSGLYIGPEDSQIDAVAYPNEIDHTIKDKWRVRWYNRYMDDSYIIMRNKADLIRVRDALLAEYQRFGIIANPKKTQIVRLRRGFTFLKTKFQLQSNGRVLTRACHESIVRERRKLKAFRRFTNDGDMSIEQVNNSYMSWRGFIVLKDAHRTVHNMDKLYFKLFAASPWINKKKRRKGKINHEAGRNSGRDHGSQVAAH